MSERQEEIRSKGFNFYDNDFYYGKIRDINRTIEDATYDLNSLQKNDQAVYGKAAILRALKEKDYNSLRTISNYFYRTNGIYKRVCEYFATIYRYDWYVVPEVYNKEVKEDKVAAQLARVLSYFDSSNIKKLCADIFLEAIKEGSYYGYIIPNASKIILQQLPSKYCRSRYFVNNLPTVEFNMRYFDEQFVDTNYRLKILKMFPEEFYRGYTLYKQGKLPPDYPGDKGAWYLLDPNSTVKFSLTVEGMPFLVDMIPSLIDLDEAQALDRKKQMQKLLKIIIQKLPLDKNGDLIFDVDEAKDIHNNAVEMLSRAVGVDVLTTFADIDSVNTSDNVTTSSQDDLAKVERQAFNAAGISQNLFNTEGNLALEKSILTDEGLTRNFVSQLQSFFDRVAQVHSVRKTQYNFRFYMLETTQFNYKELSKLYKEQAQLGNPKMLSLIALGHSQNFILNALNLENNILHIQDMMIPPLNSATMSSDTIESLESGRPEKADDEKSEKTIANQESLS